MSVEMKPVSDLILGYRDAENYRRRENKELFNQLFLRTPELDELCDSGTYFLIGEKGTGKTAYAVFLSNMEYKNNVSSLRYIRETEYSKFVSMKKSKQLSLSDYTDVWKIIIYLLLSEQIRQKEEQNPLSNIMGRFSKLTSAIDEFYHKAFSPEIIQAIKFAEEAKISAELISKYASIGAHENASTIFTESQYQVNLLYIQKQFENALSSIKLKNNHILFIDGIDIRPSLIDHKDYLDCVKGLANAIWSVNNDFFANIKDSTGRMRVVLLVRPDIFYTLGLQNQNNKIKDNAVVLNWITTYKGFRYSPLFSMFDKLLNFQQNTNLPEGIAWDYYFPFDAPDLKNIFSSRPTSFISFLRYSLYRPRDFFTMLDILKENHLMKRRHPKAIFKDIDFADSSFKRKYSDYLLGEVKDQLLFYHTPDDYEAFLKFFQYLDGKIDFSYDEYLLAYKRYKKYLKNSKVQPSFADSPDVLLQFLYDLNIICYIAETYDNQRFFGFCYRDRSPSNIAPKVRTHVRYRVHFGLRRAINVGKRFKITYE